MITITKYDKKHDEALKKLLLIEGLLYSELELCLGTMFVVEERGDILGFGYYNSYSDGVYIDHIYIKENERLNKLGDSLFRALLNSLYLNDTKFVKMRDLEIYRIFLKSEEIEKIDNYYLIDLEEFFNRKCRSEKARKTPLN